MKFIFCHFLALVLLCEAKKYHGEPKKHKVDQSEIIAEKYCNFDVILSVEQNKKVLDCAFGPSHITPSQIDYCAVNIFPEDENETSFHKVRKSLCGKSAKEKDEFFACLWKRRDPNYMVEEHASKCEQKKKGERKECLARVRSQMLKCIANALEKPKSSQGPIID